MIRVNLLPDGRKRQKRSRGVSFSLPSFGGGDAFKDRWTIAAILLVPLLLGGAGYMYMDVESQLEEMALAIDEEVADSISLFEVKQQTDLLLARSDSINDRVEIIQEIDEGRYVWAHIMDEVARALPDYTWLTSITQTGGGATAPSLQIQGQAGNAIAVSVFMRQLEASPFLRAVDLIETAQTDPGGGQVVNDFTLEASYEPPPLDQLSTVPLFESDVVAPDSVPTDTLAGKE